MALWAALTCLPKYLRNESNFSNWSDDIFLLASSTECIVWKCLNKQNVLPELGKMVGITTTFKNCLFKGQHLKMGPSHLLKWAFYKLDTKEQEKVVVRKWKYCVECRHPNLTAQSKKTQVLCSYANAECARHSSCAESEEHKVGGKRTWQSQALSASFFSVSFMEWLH